MTREEYIQLFHKEKLNLIAFKMVNDCDEEILRLVNAAIAAEREACAKVAYDYTVKVSLPNFYESAEYVAQAIRERGQA